MKKPKLSIIIPVRNEGINLKIMLKILSAIVEVPNEILVVYDSLDDNSIPVVKNIQKIYTQIKGVHNKLGRGVLNAVVAGVSQSRGDYILITAADDIGPVMAIEDMLSLMNQGCELVSSTRYAYGGRVLGGSIIGRPLSKVTNKFFYLLGSALTDSTIGIKMFKRDIFDKITLEAKPIGFAFAFELAIKAQLAGMKLGEVPIISLNRLYGRKSSFAFGPWVKEYSRWLFYGLKNYNKLMKTRNNVIVNVPLKMLKERNKT